MSTESPDQDRLIRLCEKTIHAGKMLSPGDTVLLGVSGGPDSVALLHVFLLLAGQYDYRLGIAHLNHGVRGEASDKDAEFVDYLAKRKGLPYYHEKIDLLAERGNLEEAGRNARYCFFDRIADRFGYNRIAVGHHLEDDAEMILMNLLRGSGPAGISGMRPARDRLIRPLIQASRKEILTFLDSRQLEYVQDQTNDQTVYRRNHIRHHLIPSLACYNPKIVEVLNRLGEVMRIEGEWVDNLVEPMFNDAVIERNRGELALCTAKLAGFHLAPRRRIIRRAIREVKGDLRRIRFSHIDAIITMSEIGSGTARIDLPDRIRAIRSGSRLILLKENKPLRSRDLSGKTLGSTAFEYRISREQAESARVFIREIDMEMILSRVSRKKLNKIPSGNVAAVDWDRVDFPIVIRNMRPGDRFIPLGMEGTQKLKSFFINNKVPGDQRSRIPVVVSGRRVIWVAGFRIDDRVKVTESTEDLLKITFIPANGPKNHMRAEDLEFECI